MTGLTPPDFPINAETLIGEARAARERQADEQVAAHIRGVVSRLKSHKPKGDAHALRYSKLPRTYSRSPSAPECLAGAAERGDSDT